MDPEIEVISENKVSERFRVCGGVPWEDFLTICSNSMIQYLGSEETADGREIRKYRF